jgi:ABC-type glycerol-3-phosphate transport system permease component
VRGRILWGCGRTRPSARHLASTPRRPSRDLYRDETPVRPLRIRSAWSPYVTTARYLALLALACAFLVPVYVLLVTAFKDPTEVSASQMWNLPESFSLETFREVWPVMEDGFRNSLVMAVPAALMVGGTVLSLLLR